MRRRTLGVALALTGGLAACGGGASPASSRPLLSVAGDYSIAKTVTADGCEGLTGTVTNPGTVRHTAGAITFVLNDHGTRDLPGLVEATGAFSLQPFVGQAGEVMGRDTYEGGRFDPSGFAVRVTTVVLRSQGTLPRPDCTIVTQWRGTKQGPPNVIP